MSIEPIVSRFHKLSSDEKIRLVREFRDEIAEEVAPTSGGCLMNDRWTRSITLDVVTNIAKAK